MPGLLLSALMAISSHAAIGQSNGVKVNLLAASIKTADISYERSLKPSFALQLGVLYTWASIPPWSDEVKIQGYAITPGCRIYVNNKHPFKGFFIGPFLRYIQMDLREQSTSSYGTLTGLGIGSDIGYQWLIKKKYAIEIFLGPMYLFNDIQAKSGSSGQLDIGVENPFWFKTGISLGYIF